MKIFITRELAENSPFRILLGERGHSVHGESLVMFYPVPVGDFPPADWLFFYSQTAVRYFFKQFSPEKTAGIRLAAIGKSTAELLEQLAQRPVDFKGNGEPEQVASAFLPLAEGQRVLFPRASDSLRSVQLLLQHDITALDLVVYDNRPRSDFQLPDFDALVFTSPMNVQAFFAKKKLNPSQKVVAIGATTANALRVMGVEKIRVAEMPSEKSLVEALLG